MTDTNSFARSTHDVGLAAWFGGSLMEAIGLNGAAANLPDAAQRTQTAADGWKRWAPVDAAPPQPAPPKRPSTHPPLAGAQRQLRVVQWAIPALTGTILLISARLGEQQRPAEVTSGLLSRILPG